MKKLLFLLILMPHLVYAQTIPPTLNVWTSIGTGTGYASNTHIQDVCPPNFFNGDSFDFFSECRYVTIAWSSGLLDPEKNYYYIHGGGHNNYSGNETYKWDLTTLLLTRLTNPTTPTAPGGTTPPVLDCIGSPCVSNSKHTYDGLVWMTKLHKWLLIGGSPAKAGTLVKSVWTFDPASNTWTRLSSDLSASGSGNTTVIGVPVRSSDPIFGATYDPATGFVYFLDQMNLYSFDPVNNIARSLTNRSTVIEFYYTLAFDPIRKKVIVAGGGQTAPQLAVGHFGTFDVCAGPTVQVPGSGDATYKEHAATINTAGGNNITTATGPGLQYYPVQDKWVAWGSVSSPNSIYVVDPDKALADTASGVLSIVTTTGAQSPNIETSSGNHGVYGRFQYSPNSRAFVYCGDVSANCLAVRLDAPDNTITIKEKSGSTQTNRPVTIGRPFRKGDIPNCPTAYIAGSPVTTQTNVKTRWSDGSIQHALVSFVVPSLSANASVTVTFLNGATCNTTGGISATTALTAPYDFDLRMTLAGATTKSASARTMLNAGSYRLWADGAVMTNFLIEDRTAARVYDMDPNNDGARALHPLYDCRFYPLTHWVDCGAILENDWISTTQANSTRDETFTYSLTRGSAAPAVVAVNWAGNPSEAFTTHTFTYMSRTHRAFCVSNCPGAILIDHNLAYLATTGLVENFDTTITENATQVTARKAAWTNANKTIQGGFNGTTDFIGNWERLGSDGGGGHPWIGLHTTWDIQYLYNMGSFDQTMEDLFYGNADLHGRLQIHNRELDNPAGRGLYYDAAYNSSAHTPALGRPLSIAARKEVSTQDYADSCSGTIGADKINTGPGTIEWSSYSPRYAAHHAPAASHYQYLLSGRYFYLEEMQFDASYYLAWAHGCVDSSSSPGGSRQGDKGYWIGGASNEIRGLAWMMRSLVYAAITAPDGTPEKTYYTWYAAQNRAVLEGTTGTANTDPVHLTAWTYANSFQKPSDGGSAVGMFMRYLDDGGSGVLREDGSPSRNVQNCNGAGFTCAVAPWMENFLLSALGMGNDGGMDFTNLLSFRALYNFAFATGTVNHAFIDNYRMPGKVERSYAAAPGNTGQGWMLRMDDLLQYAQSRTAVNTGAGSDQQYWSIGLGSMAFLGSATVYSLNTSSAYSTMKTAINADFVAAGSTYIQAVNGSRTPSDPDNDSCKWCILPRTSVVATPVTPPPPPIPTAPGAPSIQILP